MLTEAALLWEHPSEGLIHHSCFQPSCDQHAVISLIIMKNVDSEVFKQSSAAMQSVAPPSLLKCNVFIFARCQFRCATQKVCNRPE